MNSILFILLRRLRAPIILLICVYAISILGFVQVPGMDNEGNLWQMDFFHAFYFVSFMSTTIGFGEIPYEFTDAQRFWALICLYATVISWIYSVGAVLSVFRDEAFLRIMKRNQFQKQVNRITEPFYMICGYGETGLLVLNKLAERDIHAVIIDITQERIDALEVDNLGYKVPRLCADASRPDVLQDAGLKHTHCIGILALTNNDHANLAISIASKLIMPGRPVISRTESRDYAANLASFGTDHIVDPFEAFSNYLTMAICSPYHHSLYDWLTNPEHRGISEPRQSPKGRWIICGFGRFGKALCQQFIRHNIDATIIEPNPDATQAPDDIIIGIGTEAVTLCEAHIEDAVGIVAGTSDDANNLSIIMTAKELNPALYTVGRQNEQANEDIFDAAEIDIIMKPAIMMSNHILSLIKAPLLITFLNRMQEEEILWVRQILDQLADMIGDQSLDSWSITISPWETKGIADIMGQKKDYLLKHIMADPYDHSAQLSVMPLLLHQDDHYIMSPPLNHKLKMGDTILFSGHYRAANKMRWATGDISTTRYILSGIHETESTLLRWISGLFPQREKI